MIDGLKLTMTGEQLRSVIEERLTAHHLQAARWTEEAARTRDDETPERPLLPEHICENEAALAEWRAARLRYICDHLDPTEVYLLGERDLEFAGLLEEEPELGGPDYSEDLETLNPDHPADQGLV